jgi:DNA-nicking Smr family endonuclease
MREEGTERNHPSERGASADKEPEDMVELSPEEPFEFPIEDRIDLHAFHPRDVKAVVEEYLIECRRRGFGEVRIIHGRGTGVGRAIVRSALERSPHVLAFRDAGAERGGWGATLVELKPGAPEEPR